MMLYNTVDYPVILTIGDKTYRMERDSELELKIPSGEYPFRIHKLDRRDRPILRRYIAGGRHRRNTTVICLAAMGVLSVRRDSKIYFREKTEPLISLSTEYYKQEVYDILIENGEIRDRKDGYLDAEIGKKMVRSFIFEVVGASLGHLFLIGACVFFLIVLRQVAAEHGLSEGDFVELLPAIIAPPLAIFFLYRDLLACRNLHIFKDIPVLPEEIDYDYF